MSLQAHALAMKKGWSNMSQSKRESCESNIYHVTARGVGQQVIFEDDADRVRFGALLREVLEKQSAALLAWCFMQNHIHLLINCDLSNLSKAMEDVLRRYARYYNRRHRRTGHLFEARFASKPVEGDAQLLQTVRYIHQNPKGMGIDDVASYRWSSMGEYLGAAFITDTELVLDMLGGKRAFAEFHQADGLDPSLEPRRRRPTPPPDDEAIRAIKDIIGCDEITAIAAANKSQRDSWIAELKRRGLTVRQLARLTGLGRSIIQRAK